MSDYDDENIEFDFFDEPETVEATQRRRLPRLEMPGGRGGGERPPRPPMRAPTGLVPLARLVGLIAIAIVVVVGLVFWVGSCQGKSKHDEYQSYAGKVKTIAHADEQVGTDFANELVSSGLKQSDLETKLQQYAQQEQQSYTQAQQIRAPGPLRVFHQNLVDSIELRAKALAGLGEVLARAGAGKDQTGTAAKLTAQAELLTASDVVWEQLYRVPATAQLQTQGVKGVVIPSSVFISNTDIVSARSFALLMQRLGGASTGGTPSGKHGDGLISVRVTPQGTDLSTSSATTVKVSADLSFVATVENSGDFQETGVQVTLAISAGSAPITKKATIPLITAGQRQTVTFTGFNLPTSAFGAKASVTVTVGKVPGEVNLLNNKGTYTVFFTLS
jgi:CARDB protein